MSRVLITGGGAVSLAIAGALLRRGAGVVPWLHARSRGELEARAAACSLRGVRGVEIAGGDLLDADPFATCPTDAITHVVHGAAVTRFTVDAASAEAVNVQGTRRALDFARRCGAAFTHLSSLHAAGLWSGNLLEEALPEGPGHANEYERSKARAEALVASHDGPWAIARLGTILARDESGAPAQENAVHVTLRLLRAGLLPLVPGLPSCPVHLLTARAAGEACASLVLGGHRGWFHVTTPPALAPTLQALLHRAHARLQQDDALLRRRIPLPLLVDPATFDLLVSGAEGMASPLVTRALSCLAPFARQLHAPKIASTLRAEALTDGALARDPLPVLDAVVGRLIPSLEVTA